MDFDLNGRAAMLAHADCEAGAVVARALAREGAVVCLHGASKAELTALADGIAGDGGVRPQVYGDMATGDAVRAAQVAGLEIGIAISILPPLPEVHLGVFDDDDALKDAWRYVGSTVDLFRTALPGMTARRDGRLIFVGPVEAKAMTGRVADIDRAVGLGVLGMMKALSGEAGPHGVTCNSMLWDSAAQGDDRVRILDGLGAGAAYFASPLSNFLTGLAIAVDDGKHGGVF